MVGFLRLCQHFAKKKREMESQAANMTRPPCKAKTQTVVVRSSAEKRRKKPPKMDQSVQCSDVQQQSVQQSLQQGAQRSGQSDRVDVSEEEERELEKRLSKLQELLQESDEDSDSEDNFDAEIESALEGVEGEIAARSERTDLFVVSAKTAAVLSVDVTVAGEQSDPDSSKPDFSITKGIILKSKCQYVNTLRIPSRQNTEPDKLGFCKKNRHSFGLQYEMICS